MTSTDIVLIYGKDKQNMEKNVRRGDVFCANLDPAVGCEQSGYRPVLVLQNNTGNNHSPTTIIAPIHVSKAPKTMLPTHTQLYGEALPWPDGSRVLLEQIRVVDKCRLQSKIGRISADAMRQVDAAAKTSLGLAQ